MIVLFLTGCVDAVSPPDETLFTMQDTAVTSPATDPALAIDPLVVDFGEVSGTAAAHFTLSNTGGSDLILGDTTQDGSANFTLEVDPSGSVISPGASAVVPVSYTPTGISGDKGMVTFSSNDPIAPTATITLQGNIEEAVSYPETWSYTLDEVQSYVFDPYCTTCHNPDWEPDVADRVKTIPSLEAGDAYDSLVGQETLHGGGALLVEPGEPTQSVLMQKLGPTPPMGSTMPPFGNGLDVLLLDLVEGWIRDGAPP